MLKTLFLPSVAPWRCAARAREKIGGGKNVRQPEGFHLARLPVWLEQPL